MISRSKATASIRLAHSSKKRKDGKLSIQLRITYNRKSKYISLGHTATEEDFEKIKSGQVRGDLRELRIRLHEIESKANDIIKELDPFSFQRFESRLFRPREHENNAILYLQREVEKAKQEERISSMKMAESSLRSFRSFAKGGVLSFSDITAEWLEAYQRNMISRGNSIATVGMYLRTLRVVFNIAIREGVIIRDQYPFGKGKFEIQSAINVKKALRNEDIKKIRDYKPEPGTKEEWARDMWLFLYLCNGINPKDVISLKYEDIGPDFIRFFRTKTKHSKKNLKPVLIPLTETIQDLICKWGNPKQKPQDYVFNVLAPGLTPLQSYNRAHDFYSKINAGMKLIAEKQKIADKTTTYVARHSYASVMKRNGAPKELISENLGHSDLRTTEIYLASFEMEIKLEYNSKLLDL